VFARAAALRAFPGRWRGPTSSMSISRAMTSWPTATTIGATSASRSCARWRSGLVDGLLRGRWCPNPGFRLFDLGVREGEPSAFCVGRSNVGRSFASTLGRLCFPAPELGRRGRVDLKVGSVITNASGAEPSVLSSKHTLIHAGGLVPRTASLAGPGLRRRLRRSSLTSRDPMRLSTSLLPLAPHAVPGCFAQWELRMALPRSGVRW